MRLLNELIGSVIQLALFTSVPAVVWVLTARKEESFRAWIGFKKPVNRNYKADIMASALVTMIYISTIAFCIKMLPDGQINAGSQFEGQGYTAIPTLIVYSFFRTAMSEEVFFRGFILKLLSNRKGFIVGNIIQALLFGLMHGVMFGIGMKSVQAVFYFTLLTGGMGWYLGWLNEKRCGGSILPSWILHGLSNLVAGLMLI